MHANPTLFSIFLLLLILLLALFFGRQWIGRRRVVARRGVPPALARALRIGCGLAGLGLWVTVAVQTLRPADPGHDGDAILLEPAAPSPETVTENPEGTLVVNVLWVRRLGELWVPLHAESRALGWPEAAGEEHTFHHALGGASSEVSFEPVTIQSNRLQGTLRFRYESGRYSSSGSQGGIGLGEVASDRVRSTDRFRERRFSLIPIGSADVVAMARVDFVAPGVELEKREATDWLAARLAESSDGGASWAREGSTFGQGQEVAPPGVKMLGYLGGAWWLMVGGLALGAQALPRWRLEAFAAMLPVAVLCCGLMERVLITRESRALADAEVRLIERVDAGMRLGQAFFHPEPAREALRATARDEATPPALRSLALELSREN